MTRIREEEEVTVVEQMSGESGYERLQRLKVPDVLMKPVPRQWCDMAKERSPKFAVVGTMTRSSLRVGNRSPLWPLTAETG